MVEMERDLNTPLQWMGVDHHNTERDHVHILVRGVRDDGRVLLIDRQYISKGIRQRSQEIVERELGQRTEQEYLRTRGDAVQRDYWTEIDGALKKRAGEGRLVDYESYVPYNTAAQMKAEQEIDRLIFLERQGLARQTKEMQWELDADFEKALHDRTQEREAQLFRRNWKSREQVQEIER